MAALVIFPVFASVLLLLPLIMRGLEYTGFVAMKDAGLSMIGDLKGNFTLSRLLSPVLANMSQGFPVLVDVFVQSENGPVLADVPFGYIWRSFSPTLSFIDGFSTTWVEFNPRVNAFTPFNTVAELYGLNPVFSISFIATVYTVVTLMIRRLTGRGIKGALVALVLLALMAVSLFQLQQYQTRTFMRVIYLILLVGGSGLFLFPRQIQGRLNNRDAKK